jgi:hypothetical protein
MVLTDSARFLGDDPEALIGASFACPYCLNNPSTARVSLDEASGSAAVCRCEACASDWVVSLNLWQSLRLALAPPAEINLVAA